VQCCPTPAPPLCVQKRNIAKHNLCLFSIRRAYKKKALELHPDRNLDDVDSATRKFAEVQTAYEILSDPQERAWYDSHRDAILGGYANDIDLADLFPHAPNGRHTTTDSIFALMGRFNSSIPFTDAPTGFFGILDETFAQLSREEEDACSWEGLPMPDLPGFGSSNDDYDSVARPFYNSWSSFVTKKSFSWKDKYRTSDAPDRRIRRLIEKENKKVRDDAIREFNDAVRSLVAFVKKRDPRYVPNSQSEAERQKVLRDSAAAQAARSRAANQQRLAEAVLPDWVQSREMAELDGDSDFSASQSDSEVEQIECVVCSKIFKSDKQFEAHERSKKHVKAVQQMRREMEKENAKLDLVDGPPSPSPPVGRKAGPDSGEKPDVDGLSKVSATAQREDTASGRSVQLARSEESEATGSEFVEEGAYYSDYASRDDVIGRMTEKLDKGASDESLVNLLGSKTQQPDKKIGKAKAKRAKKAAKEASASATDNIVREDIALIYYLNLRWKSQFARRSLQVEQRVADRYVKLQCAVCESNFASRNELFAHIKQAGHAGLTSKVRKVKGGGKRG
jgi:DnaJ homolog subfamily A member 5